MESLHSVKVGGIAQHISELSEVIALKGHVGYVTRNRGLQPLAFINGVHFLRVEMTSPGEWCSCGQDVRFHVLDVLEV
jgi:hypothetical protein